MAKKTNNTEPVCAKAPLKIPKEQFTELLSKQIAKGTELLKIEVQQKPRRGASYGMYSFGAPQREGKVEYEEASEREFMSQYKMWNDFNKEIYQSSFEVPNNTYWHDYESQIYDHFYSQDIVSDYKKQIQRQITQMQSDINKIDLIECLVPEAIVSKRQVAKDSDIKKKKRVFVVHGHDTNVRNEVELFVRSIGYEPIILCKRADMGDTIIQKIEREAKDVCYAIVIYTSCDLGKDKNEADLKPRARQNVVFEHGFMCAHLGRKHVCALLENGVEQPGDLKGVIYKPLDEAGAWKYQIADEMKAVGLDVDKNKIN